MYVYVLIVKTTDPAPGLLGGQHKPTSENLGVFDSIEKCYNFAKRLIEKELIITSYKEFKELIEVEDELNQFTHGYSSEIFYGTSHIDHAIDGTEIYTKFNLMIQKLELNNDLL